MVLNRNYSWDFSYTVGHEISHLIELGEAYIHTHPTDEKDVRVAVSQSAIPARVADLRAEIASYDSEIAAREAERELGEADDGPAGGNPPAP